MIQKITDNNIVWQAVKPFFTDKTLDSDQFKFINKDEIISDDENIVKFPNDFFSNAVNSLNLKVKKSLLKQNVDLLKDLVVKALKSCEHLPSIKGIQRIVERRNITFSFATCTDIEQQLKNISAKKALQDTDIPTRILKIKIEEADFSKVFDCLLNNLHISKLLRYGYGFDMLPIK